MMDLTTLELTKTVLTIDQLETKEDLLLKQLITQASKEAEILLNRTVLFATGKVETLDVEQYQYNFSFSAFPITTFTNLWNDSTRVFGSNTIIDASSYYVNKETGWVYVDKVFLTPGRGVLKAQYNGGMAADTDAFVAAYEDIAGAIAMEVAYRYQRRKSLGIVAVTAQGGSVAFPVREQFLNLVEDVLMSHRRH